MEDSQIHVVTEFIEGGHLWKLLKKKDKALPWHVRLHLAVEIAKAITFLHAKNIMHRDLKSENVLVRPNNQTNNLHWLILLTLLTFCYMISLKRSTKI